MVYQTAPSIFTKRTLLVRWLGQCCTLQVLNLFKGFLLGYLDISSLQWVDSRTCVTYTGMLDCWKVSQISSLLYESPLSRSSCKYQIPGVAPAKQLSRNRLLWGWYLWTNIHENREKWELLEASVTPEPLPIIPRLTSEFPRKHYNMK